MGFAGARLGAPNSAEGSAEDVEPDRVLAVLHADLGAEEVANLMTVGATMTEDQAIEDALTVERD